MIKNFFLFFFFLLFISSCDKEIDNNSAQNEFGEGTYILTDNGLSYTKIGSDSVTNNIFSNVNTYSIINPKKIKIYGNRLYILGNDFYATDLNTMKLLGQVNGFSNAAGCAIITQNRAFVTDKSESSVKLIDLYDYKIISEIETGEGTSPSFIFNKFDKSFVLNGGNNQNYDSTLITITYRDNLIPLADFSGNLIVGKNPRSAISTGNIKVLCSGVFDESNSSLNIQSSFYNINPSDLTINFSQVLPSIYNANNLVESWSGNNYYFTAIGGVYRANNSMTNINLIIPIQSDVMKITSEKYAINDTTDAYSNILYMNDLTSPGMIYKYNINLSSFVDTISVSGRVLDIQFKN